MVDTWDTDTFHWIFSLLLSVDSPPNEFKPDLSWSCVFIYKKLSVVLEIDPYVISLDFFQCELSQRLQIFQAEIILYYR